MIDITEGLRDPLERNPKAILDEQTSTEIVNYLNDLADASNAYKARKMEQFKKRKPKIIEEARLHVNGFVADQTAFLKQQFAATEIKNPMQYLQFKLQKAQAQATSLNGEALKSKLAEVLYLNVLQGADYKTKQSNKLLNALTEQGIENGKSDIINCKAFSKIAALPEDELKFMISERNVSKLGSLFKKELAKDMQKENKRKQNKPEENKKLTL